MFFNLCQKVYVLIAFGPLVRDLMSLYIVIDVRLSDDNWLYYALTTSTVKMVKTKGKGSKKKEVAAPVPVSVLFYSLSDDRFD